MIEDAAKEAFSNLNQTLLGTMLFLSWFVFGITIRWLNIFIKELKEELRVEREAHKKTVDTQITDIRNLANVATSVDNLRPLIEMMIRNQKEVR